MYMVIEACTCMNQSVSMQVKCFHLSVCMCPIILISIRSALNLPKLRFVADVAGCQNCVCKTPVQKPNVLSLTMHVPSCKKIMHVKRHARRFQIIAVVKLRPSVYPYIKQYTVCNEELICNELHAVNPA